MTVPSLRSTSSILIRDVEDLPRPLTNTSAGSQHLRKIDPPYPLRFGRGHGTGEKGGAVYVSSFRNFYQNFWGQCINN